MFRLCRPSNRIICALKPKYSAIGTYTITISLRPLPTHYAFYKLGYLYLCITIYDDNIMRRYPSSQYNDANNTILRHLPVKPFSFY